MPMMQHVVLALLWIGFCALHSLLASGWLKRKLQKNFGAAYRFYRLFYTLFATLSFAGVLTYQFSLPSPRLYYVTPALYFFGGLIGITGLTLMVICIRNYFADLSGLKSLIANDNGKNELRVHGVHRFVRHPLYLGTFLFIWGTFVVLPYVSLLVSNSVITGYTLLGIRWEEQKLIAEFGDAYRNYRQNVPRLLPRFRKANG